MLENLEAVVVGILLSLNDVTDNEPVSDVTAFARSVTVLGCIIVENRVKFR